MQHLISKGYHTAINMVSDAVVIADGAGQVITLNEAARRLFGDVGGRALIGQPVRQLFETSVETSEAYIARAAEGEQRVPAVVRLADGERRAVLVRIVWMPPDVGMAEESSGIVVTLEDVTDEFQARRAVAKAGQAQKLEAIGQLVSGVAHELNNPLAAVVAYAQLVLASRELSDDDRNAVDTILQEAKRAAKIVSNLLTFARQHQPERTITDINQVVLDTVALRRYTLGGNEIELTVDLDKQLPLIWVDHFQIQQVLFNLMSNAEHALQGWDGERRLTIATKSDGDQLLLTVSDSGPGISETILEQIFNPFFTTKSVGNGTGLGLSISDGIVRGHGGRIRVESEPGKGATFIVELPYTEPAHEFPDDPLWRTS
jgi:two-component system NtrC family sensor kinase